MSETKNEIPSAMLDAATAAIRELRETKGIGFAGSAEIARIALNAAGVPALIAERDSLEVHAIELGCDLDNERRRCAVLTGDLAKTLARIAELEAEVAVALEELRADWQRQKIEAIDPSESLYPDQQGHNSMVESFVEDLDAVIIKLGLTAEATEVSE